jgi:hypothetical protein
MRVKIQRDALTILPDVDLSYFPPVEVAFLEEVLGLKADRDSILLVRRNFIGVSEMACLETEKLKA